MEKSSGTPDTSDFHQPREVGKTVAGAAAAARAALAAARAAAAEIAEAIAEAEARQKLPEEIAKRIKKLEEEVEQERLKNKVKGKRRQANYKKRLGENAKEEAAEASGEKEIKVGSGHEMLEQCHDNPSERRCEYRRSNDSTSDQSSSEILGILPPINLGFHLNQGECSKEVETKISEDAVTEIAKMPNDWAPATNSSFASSHNSFDVPNCNLINAKDKTRMHPLMSEPMCLMRDGPSQETRFPHDGTSTLMPDVPSQQTRLANDNNNTTLGDPIVMLDGPSQEMGELEMTSNGLEERINIPDDDDDGSASSGDDNVNNDSSVSSSNDEVQPRRTRLRNGINTAIIGSTGQGAAALIALNSPDSLPVQLFAYGTSVGFLGSLLSPFFLKRRPNISEFLFKIGVTGSASTVMIALGRYLPTQWNLNIAVPAVACLIIAVMVALSKLD